MVLSHIKLNPDEGKKTPKKELYEGLWETIRKSMYLAISQTEKPKEKWILSMGETIRKNQELSKHK